MNFMNVIANLTKNEKMNEEELLQFLKEHLTIKCRTINEFEYGEESKVVELKLDGEVISSTYIT